MFGSKFIENMILYISYVVLVDQQTRIRQHTTEAILSADLFIKLNIEENVSEREIPGDKTIVKQVPTYPAVACYLDRQMYFKSSPPDIMKFV